MKAHVLVGLHMVVRTHPVYESTHSTKIKHIRITHQSITHTVVGYHTVG